MVMINPALRRAFIRVKPDYFALCESEREHYRQHISKEDGFRIRQIVVKELFGLEINTAKELDSALDAFDDARYLRLNSALLPLQGIGDDAFFLNEYLATDVTLLSFVTVGDYARDDHQFQEQARHQDDPNYVPRPYRGNIHRCWARMTINDAFHYADICSLEGYLVDILEEHGFDRIADLIPHKYIDGPNHGRRADKGFVYDKRIDAGGLEGQLEALRDRYYAYLKKRSEKLLDRFDIAAAKQVFMCDRSRKDDPHMDFVFSDKAALDSVRFRHFVNDCRRIAGDNAVLYKLVDQERHTALDFLTLAHQEIMHNFDPTVVKLRRKRKVILANDKLIDLL
jgi:hypothetical protein